MKRNNIITGLLLFLGATAAQAQITIGGNVYGGGNAGNTQGGTSVTVYAGDLNAVYGGARKADVKGSTFVHIDGEHASDNIFINQVYGGNDIAGTVGTKGNTVDVPTELKYVVKTEADKTDPEKNAIDGTWNAFVRTSPTPVTTNPADRKSLVIGSLFGGGNGDYDYTSDEYKNLVKPELGKTYLEILGGCIAHLYGGGNNATVTENTTICINNDSPVLTETNVWPADPTSAEGLAQLAALAKRTGLSTYQSNPSSYAFNFARVFGGNNKADMAIRPIWNLRKGIIRDLYSGGNEGRMTHPNGILLETVAGSDITAENVYGGCRKADVRPMAKQQDGSYADVTEVKTLEGYFFPKNFAARLLLKGGNFTNVYGGNDIKGRVYFGNAIGLYTSIKGNLYGGGNGSYAFTDILANKDDSEKGEFYYDPGQNSLDALNSLRPDAEQVSIHLVGDKEKPTVIHGSVYCGGNSASLSKDPNKVGNSNYPNYPVVELKIGSYVIADNVFLGNNGENMVSETILKQYADNNFSSLNLKDATNFATYMKGAAMDLIPSLTFDNLERDGRSYELYSSKIGSLYCGGNVGSMTYAGTNTMNFNVPIYIYDKVVGGCNNAIVKESAYNARYEGGILGTDTEQTVNANGYSFTDTDGNIRNRLVMNFNGVQMLPQRWNDTNTALEWNTYIGDNKVPAIAAGSLTAFDAATDLNRRFREGHIYGGCYSSGIVNGNVVINLNATTVDREKLFDRVQEDELGEASLYGENVLTGQGNYTILERRTGVLLGQQGMDVLGAALNVFGGGKGKDTEIWGSTTINLNAGYTFQLFGGSEEGVIGKSVGTSTASDGTYNAADGTYAFNGKSFKYDPKYSCYVNLRGTKDGVSKRADQSPQMAECEFMYGGGFFGPIVGNTVINLGRGRIFNSFAGSCNADILGHTETFIGRQVNDDGTSGEGFPYIRDYVYGGNDLGGQILGQVSFKNRVRSEALGKVHGYDATSNPDPDVLKASAYMEYTQGRAVGIFGGCFGTYDYTNPKFKEYTYTTGGSGTTTDNLGTARPGFIKPRMDNAFVNFRPTYSDLLKSKVINTVEEIYGSGQGYPGDGDRDIMQNRSYVLIDIPQEMENYKLMQVFGGGAWSGLGMDYQADVMTPAIFNDYPVAYDHGYKASKKDSRSAIIDLVRGQIGAAYGGSLTEGVIRRTLVNVPQGSTIQIGSIFGGGYGTETLPPCDVIEAHVEYHSADACLVNDRVRTEEVTDEITGEKKTYQRGNAVMLGNIYGGNNDQRRSVYSKINIDVPVYQKHYAYGTTKASVYGAGYGANSWAEYTEVNLNEGAEVYEVYGGGEMGHVLNAESVQKYMTNVGQTVQNATNAQWAAAWKLGGGYDAASFSQYAANSLTNLDNTTLVRTAKMDDRATKTYKYNTNVIINKGATVHNYAYGGGLGVNDIASSGDIYGTTYIALLGGTVKKDLYAAGTLGGVYDAFGVTNTVNAEKPFIASANAYIEGGTARNVYGGGWRGSVGYHNGSIDGSYATDILGETHVVIGTRDGTNFFNGIPAIERNAYGGGEGGAVFGTANTTLNNGFIGYRRFDAEPTTDTDLETIKIGNSYYQEKLHDETWKGDGTNRLYDSGCVFGGGYIDNSNVDVTNVKMYGGHVRNGLFGGGEIAAIGRGIIDASGEANSIRTLRGIYRAGKTNVDMFDGHVHRNVFGGGRGYNNLGEGGTLYSDGYVFGQTEVHVHGGEVGTSEGLELGFGNVFGGGDIGYVYSAYEEDGKLYVGIKDGERYDDKYEGYYYAYDLEQGRTPGNYVPYKPADFVYDENDPKWLKDGDEFILTEDCKVLVEPHCKVLEAVTINNHAYNVGDYVSTADLNSLQNKNSDAATWGKLDADGIIIHNAVFAGGNTSAGSATVYANATTVLGNATASIHDVYHRDLITVGTGHTGGLYGDGNLTFVDGYRGLNITNYGTDYYTIQKEIDIDQYHALPDREAAYYELRYKCLKACVDKDGTHYTPGSETTSASTITADDLITLFKGITDENGVLIVSTDGTPNPAYWEENGVCSRYAGRLMNTIQRADFCGVFGSRMVMQGAQDRVPEIVDYTNYTINRVREVSLNQQHSVIAADLVKNGTGEDDYENKDRAIHGNYFGIYNIVNYLGALSSDVHFKDKRVTDNTSNDMYKPDSDNQTFYDWKSKYVNERKRNNGTSLNKVALASGVYLELTTEKSTGKELNEKDWGYITGVIELDLINVQTGIGGGFVYAKNEHRTCTYNKKQHSTLTALNADAVTRRDFDYANNTEVEWETSGNFVHSTQTIIDDCYNISGKYKGSDAVPAHYWYIKGQVYVYDQYISAYTGSPNAYSETVDIPLTITAASHGTMKLLNVMPNRYAYYATSGTPLESGKKVIINDVTYYKNDPISYWDWYLLSPSEKDLFVEKTYVSVADCQIGDKTYPAGTVLLPAEYESWKTSHPTVYHVDKQENVDFDFVFRSSNNLSHDTGYILTYKVNNPTEWSTWYTKYNSSTQEKQQTPYTEESHNGPTYRLVGETGGVLGQREYSVSNVISKDVYDTYQAVKTNHPEAIPSSGQATFEKAMIVTKQVDVTKDGHTSHLYPGTAVSATEAATMAGSVADAYICTSTIQLSKTEFIYLDTKMSEAERTAYYNRFKDGTAEEKKIAAEILANIVPAYYCTSEGMYGGDYYESGKNYRGLAAWSAMSANDRAKFAFNYDALDLLIDPTYSRAEGQKHQYDGQGFTTEEQAKTNKAGYSLTQPVDYTATYYGDAALPYVKDNGTQATATKADATELSRTEFERLPNEQRHYAPLVVRETGNVYVVNAPLQIGNTPYAVGTTITTDVYNSLGNEQKSRISTITFTNDDLNKTYFFCRESYTVGENGEGQAVTNANVTGSKTGTYAVGAEVPVGLVINENSYKNLVNMQTGFTIHGIAPTETSTLFVSRNSDIFDLSTEKIITVIYQYDYEESDASGNVTPISERHVVNIHVTFKSGIPTVEDIKAPQTVIPGDQIGLREPNVTPGAYEVTGGGWELFESESDAESHINGIAYTPTFDPLYWYQDGYYVAYYAKTYLGKTYSNYVPVSVANYHDLKKVMEAKDHHYYVDNPNVKRSSKIYINNYTDKNGLDLLKDFFDLSVNSSTPAVAGHAPLNSHVKAGDNLEFFLRSNIDHSGLAWTPIGSDNQCFEGTLHGDGYNINGLTQSLFSNLCGSVFNLGVTGSFTGAGVAEKGSGYVENSWIATTNTAAKTAAPVLGTPTGLTTDRPLRIVNCYYQEEDNAANKYSNHTGTYGTPTRKTRQAFYNGEVAYNLNGFYLYKRYCDQKVKTGTNTYTYYTTNVDDGTLSQQTGYYGPYDNENAKWCLSGYVEDRFADGDFVYAGGSVPEGSDARQYTDAETGKTSYYPIWPDDYLFFGQSLNYDHVDGMAHQNWPSAISKSSGRLLETNSNRVYRAPAYYRSKQMGVAHFNPAAVFAQTRKDDASTLAYKNMTAIDFTGHNDLDYALASSGTFFYPPLLDDDGLTSFRNIDLTKNLLAYTGEPGTATAAGKTGTAVSIALHDEAYAETNDVYRTVDVWDKYSSNVYGHWVQQSGGSYVAQFDHMLVDRQDFNAPIAYRFAADHRMWYQREPDRFVDLTKGWEDISLPFTADIVTTQTKGELTHFYEGSTTGHEYWLRGFEGNVKQKEAGVYTADFKLPKATGLEKAVSNTFLWDYFYEGNHSQQDMNNDIYQTYYNNTRTYGNYPRLTAAVPYIIGFPGSTYYEFDLSGTWKALTTASPNPDVLEPQVITFASKTGESVGVSDDETAGITHDGYTFKPSFMNEELAVGNYVMNGDGSSYTKLSAEAATNTAYKVTKSLSAFRPYFTSNAGSRPQTRAAEHIVFGNDGGKFGVEDRDSRSGSLLISSMPNKIVVTSALKRAADVRIVTPAGVTLETFTIQPGETIETRVILSGVYIVQTTDGRYTKKLSVK